MHKPINTLSSALMSLTLAAIPVGAAYTMDPPDSSRDNRKAMREDGQPSIDSKNLVFVSGAKVRGMTVKNGEDKTLGTIDDLIIDRGSGRIRHIVMKSGATMGLGGKLVTVPYQQFGWDSADKHVTLNATPEDIKAWPEFNKDRWVEGARTDESFIRTLGRDYYDTASSPWPVDSQTERESARRVKGTVKSISRQDVGGREELTVVISTPGSPDQEVVLGPSWYLGGNNSISFYRDAPIDIDVFHTTRDGRAVTVARSASINSQNLAFYDEHGRARWAPNSAATSGDPFVAAPFVLFTDVKGKPVDCRGETCGKVKDLVMECTTGRIAFLSIDPDKAFLGIGDQNRLVPWSVMTRSLDGKVHLDANKSMITSAPTTPSDLKTLSGNDEYKRIYGLFDTQPMSFGNRR